MMREVLRRRFARLIKEDPERAGPGWPDLVVIDGGAGQLSAAQAILAELGLVDLPLLAVAKGPERNAGQERFFLPGREPLALDPRDPVLYFVQRLRDEAHRFAIQTHRGKRTREIGRSVLDQVPGVGAKRKRALLNHFGSARGVARGGCAGPGAGARGSIGRWRRRSMISSTTAPEAGARMLTSTPNLLTVSRIACIPVLVAVFYVDGDWARWVACADLRRRRHHRLCRRLPGPQLAAAVAVRPLARPGRRQAAGRRGRGDAGRFRARAAAAVAGHRPARDHRLRPARVHGRGQRRAAGQPRSPSGRRRCR